MIEVRNLTYLYPDGTQGLDDASIDFPPEHIFGVLGQSGSGKTTLLNCIARFLEVPRGKIRLDDQDIHDVPEKEFRRRIGVVFQDLNLFPHLSILDNMTLAPVKAHGTPLREAKEEALEILERLDVGDLADTFPRQVSGGQGQRVAIARALMLHPEYLLLDEPTSALDAQTSKEFACWLKELNADASFVIVTHDVPFALEAASHGVYMKEGKIVHRGSLTDVLDELEDASN